MFCTYCGQEIASGARACAACGRAFVPPPPEAPSGARDPLDQMAKDMEKAAKELGAATARLSKRVLEKASSAADDPKGAAKRTAQRVREELERARDDLDRILHKGT